MSEVPGSAAPAAAAPTTSSSHPNTAQNDPGAVPPGDQKAAGGSNAKNGVASGDAKVDGKSTTGAPDNADKAAAAVQQGRELTAKELALSVTRTINGQKVTKTISEWIGASQLEQASHQRFQQAQHIMQQANQIVSTFKQNPKEFLRQNGIDPIEFSKSTLEDQLKLMGMSEVERELYQLRAEKQAREEADTQAKAQKEQQDAQAKDTAEYNTMVKDSLEAWKESGLPDDPYFGQRMAATIASHQSQGIPLTWKEAALIVKQDWMTSNQRVLANFQSVEELANYLGEPILKKLRQHELGRVTSRQASKSSAKRPEKPSASHEDSKPSGFVNERDYNAYWNKLGFKG